MAKKEKDAAEARKRRSMRNAAEEPSAKASTDNPRFDAIVIGTGFGGAVTACRLAQAGFKVLILERGRRYEGETKFPRDFSPAAKGWLWGKDRGLFDARVQDRIVTVQAAGYGGGSLVYANVHIQPPPEVFAKGWPDKYDLPSLKPYYNLVAHMLNIAPITASTTGLPPKSSLMRDAAGGLNRAGQFFFPNLAINFGQLRTPFQDTINASKKCDYCGECVIGCSEHAKNTLDLNYLRVAEKLGSIVQTECEAMSIGLKDGGYVVNYVDLDKNKTVSVPAPRVFLCAGALNSTELLLRCRDDYGTLPNLSPRLGRGFSGNGDFIAFAFDTQEVVQPSRGPTITSAVIYNNPIVKEPIWFLLEDGGYPSQISKLVQILNPLRPPKGIKRKIADGQQLFSTLRTLVPGAFGMPKAQEPGKPTPEHREDHVAVLLAMGRDRANGTIRWGPKAPQAWVDWDARSNLPLYDEEELLSTDFAESKDAFNGTVAVSPLWKRLRLPISVHNLGGCAMSQHEGDGVVDEFGQVWGYPNLYVLDGSILPASTGVNPSHTIAAVAERNVEAAIRIRPSDTKWKADPDWHAPQWDEANANPVLEPMPIVSTYTRPPLAKGITIKFEETLTGVWRPPFSNGKFADLTVSIETPLLDEFLLDKDHRCPMEGVFRAADLTDPGGATISDGQFSLFVEDDEFGFYSRKMVYEFTFLDKNKHKHVFHGIKRIRDRGLDRVPMPQPRYQRYLFDIWNALTQLSFTLTGDSPGPVPDGDLTITAGGVLDQLLSMQVPGSKGWLQKTWQQARLGKFFINAIFDVYVRDRYPTGIKKKTLPK